MFLLLQRPTLAQSIHAYNCVYAKLQLSFGTFPTCTKPTPTHELQLLSVDPPPLFLGRSKSAVEEVDEEDSDGDDDDHNPSS